MTAVTKALLLETMQAFKHTALLRAAVELRVFDALAAGPATAAEVAKRIDADERATAVLLGAVAATGFLDADGSAYALAEGAADLLVTTGPGYAGGAVRVAAGDREWDALRDLAGVVRAGGTVLAEGAESPGFAYWEEFADQVTYAARATAGALADALEPLVRGRDRVRLLDVGCGHALYGLTVARRVPSVRVTGLDWDNVLPYAERSAARMGLADRLDVRPGDAFSAPLGGPYDLIVLANVLPQFSERRCGALLRRLRAVLAPGGRLAIAGFAHDGAAPHDEHAAHMLSLLMLAWTAGGQVHSVAAYRAMLAAAGFADPEVRAVPGLPAKVLAAAAERTVP